MYYSSLPQVMEVGMKYAWAVRGVFKKPAFGDW